MENSNEHMMQQMMQQFVAFFQQQQVMQQRMNLEDRMRKACQYVIEKLDRFDGRDISKFCRAYEEAMEDYGIGDADAIDNFHLITIPQLRGRIGELQSQHSVSWRNFKVALKEEYYLEELERVPEHSFIKWFQAKKRRTGKSIVEDSHEGFGENDTIEKIVEKPKVLSSPTSMDSTMEDFFKGHSILTNLGSARMEKNADEMICTKSTHVMEICKDDNEEAGDTIQETTGRTNPVDSLLEVQVDENFMEEKQKVEEEILKVQTNEAFVKDKCNNEEEILEISIGKSRASIRTNGEQMPKATPSPKAQIKDASKDKKQSKVCGPSFKLSCDIELAIALKVFKELIDNKVKVTWRDILGWNKEGFWNQKKFKKRRFSQDFHGVKKDQILQGAFSSSFVGLTSEGSYSYRKFGELHKWEDNRIVKKQISTWSRTSRILMKTKMQMCPIGTYRRKCRVGGGECRDVKRPHSEKLKFSKKYVNGER
ncbi:hypothetical protein L7F22_000953 [Adiantum nelumboides]|nr:hypothetical protein [Adiantum nelumboides]